MLMDPRSVWARVVVAAGHGEEPHARGRHGGVRTGGLLRMVMEPCPGTYGTTIVRRDHRGRAPVRTDRCSTRSAARVVPAPRPHASPASLPYASTVQEPLGNLPGTLLLGGTHVSCPCCRAVSVLRDPAHWPRPWISTRHPLHMLRHRSARCPADRHPRR